MSLCISYVRRLQEVIAPAEAFLRRQAGDLFARPHIVVPTAGVTAWLEASLARRLGAADSAKGDGVVANVGFMTPAAISSLLEGNPAARRRSDDPWEVERLTFTILEVVAGDKRYASRITQAGGPLLAARAIADRFDHYHFRQSGMILAWDEGRPELSPAADDDGRTVTTLLAGRDRWQFELWREVRERIGEPSPPARARLATTAGCQAVFVAGLQSLSLHQINLLERLSSLPTAGGGECEVEVVLVHPSPPLREAWAREAPPVSQGIAPARKEEFVAATSPHTADPLLTSWLRGTREAQWLLASQGERPTHDRSSADADALLAAAVAPATDATLLARLHHTITSGHIAAASTGASPLAAGDHSLLVHRCHDLSRQAEVLFDAIVHAFADLDDLAPHDVVIVSPRIAELAPHLEAEFSRTVQGEPNLLGSSDGTITLPLVIADRGIHEMHPAAELLAALLALAGSRCSVDAMLAVAAHPLVQTHFHVDENDIDTWRRCIAQTHIRWGLDADRRERAGLAVPELSAHSWRLGLERMLLGAIVSDGAPEPVLGDVVPLAYGEAAEVTSLAPLVSIFRLIDTLDLATAESKPVDAWCDLLEETLAALVGDEADDLEIPLQQIDLLRKAAISGEPVVDVAVPFHDVKTLLTGRLTAAVGRQPLLTGAITATSMIPLRGVPFRVVCVAGFDEAALNSGENDSDDLATRQELLGDTDPRLELRRSLLDSVLAARNRVVITCTGMDVKNNTTLPLVTPLAELVDFAGRHGVTQVTRNGEPHSSIEVFHPRHACSRANFEASGVLPDTIWSHDTAARAAATALGQEQVAAISAAAPIDPPAIIDLDWLAAFLGDPLWPYVNKTLGINVWRDDDLEIPATLPLELERRQQRDLREGYLEKLLATDNRRGLADAWAAAVRANGDVPVLGYGGDVIEHIQQFSHALLDAAALIGTPLDERSAETVHLDLAGITLVGTLEAWFPKTHSLVFVRPEAQSTSSPAFQRAKFRSMVQLLAARAAGHTVEQAIIFSEHENWSPGATAKKGRPVEPVMRRQVILDEAIDANRARALLTALGQLYQQAAIRPHGLFGETATALAESREAALDTFTALVGNRGCSRSEVVVYGLTPVFDAVFPADDPRLPFFATFPSLTATTYSSRLKAYVYAPPAHTA